MPITLLNTNNQGAFSLQNNANGGSLLLNSGEVIPTTTTSTTTTTTTIVPTTTTTSTTTTTTTSGQVTLYSNFEQYIIGGVRQAITTALVRTNISATRRLVVTDTITVTGFRLIRIPPNNWSSISGYAVTGTLAIVAGTGATIDGGVTNKSFNTKSTVNTPSVVAERANTTSQYDIYDVRPVNNTLTVLTPGEYNIGLFGTSANMDLAILTNSIFPIDTTKKIYPSTTAATTHFAMQVF